MPGATIAVLAIVVVAACAPDARGPGIDVDKAVGHAALISGVGPRPGDSETARAAAAYIEHELAMPVERLEVGTVELPEITVLGTTHRPARTVVTTDPDLLVRFGPPGKALLVMAHYDTVRGSPGAVDNAAAVGVLIELAHVLAKEPPSRPVMLAFTSNEEIGLVGAEALAAKRGDQIDLAIALDLVGGSGTLIQNGASDLIGLAEMRWLAHAAERAGVVVRAPLAHRVVSRWWPQAERSDHGPFTRRGVRAFHLYNRGQDGEWIDLAYHSENDLPSRISPASVDELGRLLRALIAEPLPEHDGDAFWLPVATNTVVPRWMLILGCAVVAALAIGLLIRQRRPLGAGNVGALVAIACYAAAAGVMFAIERAVGGPHPAPWLHAPLRWVIGELLVIGGVLGLATRLAARWRPWVGERRYLSIAVIAQLVIGLAWFGVGAAELAWIWLLPAMLIAFAPRVGRGGIALVASALLPVVLVLGPDQVREAAWNGFLAPGIPLVLWIALLSFPLFAGIGWYLRTLGRSGPLGTLILSVGCLLAALLGTGLLGLSAPVCSAAQFHEFRLACEVTPRVP